VVNAENKPLDFINEWTNETDRSKTYYIHCAAGYRSMVASSILKARGFDNIINIEGGYGALSKTEVPKTNLTHAK
jgi:hydroxyacylglutathione hydrolase